MKIEKVHIKNIKGIKDLELLFKKNNEILDVIVLAGVNGSGKTTILESIKDFFDNRNVNYNEPEKSNINLNIFFEEFEKNNIKEAEKNCKDRREHKLKDFFEGLRYYEYSRKKNGEYYDDLIAKKFDVPPKIIYVPAENKFEEIQTYSTTLLREYKFINIINSNVIRDIPSYIATRRNYLSSGEKQLFLRTLSIKMLEPKNSIILIDEPELSLHPKWQQRIIEVYKKIGENNQIIIATHSPHILGSVSNENIFILYRDEKGKIEAKTGDELYSSYGQPVDRVLKDIMGLESVRTPKIEKDLEELRKLVDEDKYATKEFKEKYNELLEILGNTDEDLFLIDMDAKLKQKVNFNVESK